MIRWILIGYAAASLVTFVAFGLDKRAASRGTRRIRERSLHLLELIGGWPGSLLGQSIFKHKRAKLAYVAVFWLIVALHVAAWIYALWSGSV